MKRSRAHLSVLQGRKGIFNLESESRCGKLMVEYDEQGLVRGDFVWNFERTGAGSPETVFRKLFVVVWAKSWNGWGSTVKRQFVRFRPATVEECALEEVMTS